MDERETFQEAVWRNDLSKVGEMLGAGFDANAPLEESRAGLTIARSVEMARLLVAHGAFVGAERPRDGYTSLHHAAEEGRDRMLEVLLGTKLGGALGTFDYVSRTPLMCAVQRNRVECARLLLQAGSDVNAHDEPRIGDTALHVAVEEGLLEMFEMLLEAGADPEIEGWMRLTPRLKAEARGDDAGRGMLRVLRKRGL
jgi:ankyrin repeat protein